MKRTNIKILSLILGVTVLSSCYTYKNTVGDGAQGNKKVTKWNHYLIGGLAPVGVSDSKAMAGDATNYEVETRQTFVNGFISMITFGLYTPTTTTVSK